MIADTLSQAKINAVFHHAQHTDWSQFALARQRDEAILEYLKI